MCIFIDQYWFTDGVNMILFDVANGQPDDMKPFIDQNAFEQQTGVFPKLRWEKPTVDDLTSLLLLKNGIKPECIVTQQEYVNRDGKTFWKGCTKITQMVGGCVSRTLSADNNYVMFNTVLTTANTEIVPQVGLTNYRIPIQCSYPLNYNLDLFLGTVDDTDPDNVSQ